MTPPEKAPRQAPEPRLEFLDPPSRGAGFRRLLVHGAFSAVVMALGAVYGVLAYAFFVKFFSSVPGGPSSSGVMLVSFLAGVPLAIGVSVGWLARRRESRLLSAGGMGVLSTGLMVFAVGALFREGTICILMALIPMLLLGLLGVVIAALISPFTESHRSPKLLAVVWMLPLAFGAAEQELDSSSAFQVVQRNVHIEAAPERVWQLLNFPLDIQPAELKDGWAYRIGVPYPLEARTLEPRIGGRRALTWQRGIHFEERITEWEPARRIAWRYEFGPDAFPPGSLDDHIAIGGRYFGLEDTFYTLTPEAGGTRLEIRVTTRVTTHFNAYAALWARWLVDDTAGAILGFYKRRAEG